MTAHHSDPASSDPAPSDTPHARSHRSESAGHALDNPDPTSANADGRPGEGKTAGDGAPTEPASPKSSFPFDTLIIRPWDDSVIEKLGHDPRSAYVERYWTSILGPSATLLLRRLANGLEIAPDGFEIDTMAWAQELGLGIRGGKHGPFWRSIDRTARFGATRRNGALIVVRRKLPPLNLRQVERLPDHLRAAHRTWEAAQLSELDATDAA